MSKINVDEMLVIDETGMALLPNVRQLMNKNIRLIYNRDKSKDKHRFIQECIVIYYLGDPKSPAKQAGLNDAECLKEAIKQADLEEDYIPDGIVQAAIAEYLDNNLTEAGRTILNIQKAFHAVNLMADKISTLLTEKLTGDVTFEEIPVIQTMIDNLGKGVANIPTYIKKLNEAFENLLYEKEIAAARGGNSVLSSMEAY